MNIDLAIDPYSLDGPWDERRVQAWFLFGVCVAGKSAKQTAEKITAFLDSIPQQYLPFAKVNWLIQRGKLRARLEKFRMGQYARIEKAFRGIIEINPRGVSLLELERIHGVGPKTARMLLLYTRPGIEVVPLDTHILKWLKANGYDAPKSTPPLGKKYLELEKAFILEGKKRGLTAREWDTKVWKMYAKV